MRGNRRRGGRLHEHLRYGKRKHLRGRHSSGGLPPDRPSIHSRPAHVQQRRVQGHWEGDTLMGRSGNPHRLLSLVERSSRYLRLRRPRGGYMLSIKIAKTTARVLRSLPSRSIV